jgi:hypothetical protein
MIRGFQRLKGDASLTLSQLIGNFIMALIIGSVFYQLEIDTGSFYSRGALLFFAVLLNAFGSALEVWPFSFSVALTRSADNSSRF